MSLPILSPAQPPVCVPYDSACQAGLAADSMFTHIVTQVANGAADLVVTMATWWVETDSVDPTDPAVTAAQGATHPLIVVIMVGAVLVQAIRMILSRKGEPLLLVATGLIRYAVVSALGLVTLQIALRAGDALASQLLDDAVTKFAQLMKAMLVVGDGATVFLVLLMALIAAALALIQWVLMALRQAGLLVLAAMLPLAASGSLTRSTRGWLDKLIVWLIAIVAYKPAAAFIYYIGFTYLSSPTTANSGSVARIITGIMVLLLAVIALPALLKFFSWSGTQLGGATSGGSAFLGAVGAATGQRYFDRWGVDRAAAMESGGPGSVATTGTYAPPSGAAPAATVPSARAASTGAARTGATSAGAGSGAAAAGGAAASAAGPAAAAAVAGEAAARGAAQAMTGGRENAGPGGGAP